MVDDDTALIQGRELLGFPKKMADFTWEEKGDTVVGTVTRKGVELMRMEGRIGPDEPDPTPLLGRRFVNAMGSVVAGMQIVDFMPSETFHSAARADVAVKLASSIWDPGMGELEASVIGPGMFAIVDFGGGAEPPRVSLLDDDAWAVEHFLPRST
ncbi:MAG: acetoacetate decarboxylase family protein [Acidimicrobiia bacterium]|nr:acetoacetate decarboxylase family protein [Acidimicrobiia bacterium]